MTLVSGGELSPDFAQGWGLRVLSHETVHWWVRDTGAAVARPVCHMTRSFPVWLGNGQFALFGGGDFPKCRKCLRIRRDSP